MPKSIIQVDVQDAAWKAFQAAFGSYQKSLAKMPELWKQSGAEQQKATKAFETQAKDLNNAAGLLAHVAKSQGAIRKEAESTDKVFKSMAASTKSIARDILSATASLAKWAAYGGLFTLGASVGGFLGMGGLASGASNLRRTSQGFGVSPGELRAAEVNYSKYVDVGSTLGNIGNVQSDLSKRWILSALGVSQHDATTKNAAELLPDLIPKAIAKFKRFGSSLQGAQASGLTDIFSFQELRRLSSLSPGELNQTAQQYKQDRSRLGIEDSTLQRWQQLNTQLDRAKYNIENVFLNGLERLAGPLNKLSDSFVKATETFFKSDKAGKWVEEFGTAMEKVATYIASDKFERDIHTFVNGLDTLATGLGKILRFFGLLPDEPKPDAPNNPQNFGAGNTPGGAVTATPGRRFGIHDRHNPGNLKDFRTGQFASYGSDDEGLRAMAAQLRIYQNKYGINTVEGAISRWAPAKDHNDLPAYINDVLKRSGLKGETAYNFSDPSTLARLMSAMAKHENANNNFSPAQVESIITVQNATGGNVVTSMKQLAH